MTEETTSKVRVSEHVLRSCNKLVRETPGVRSDAISKELSLGQTTVSRAGICLERQGLVTRVRKGKFLHYYPAGAQDVTVRSITATDVEIEALKAEIEDLRREVEDLRAFKARATVKYPELDVDTIVLEARKIGYRALFEAGNRDGADTVILGDADNSPFVLAIVEALRAATKQVETE